VLTIDASVLTLQHLLQKIEEFQSGDDVWTSFFLQTVIVQAKTANPLSVSPEADNTLQSFGTRTVHVLSSSSEEHHTFAEGPYFMSDGKLHAAYLLYPDTSEAFIVATVSTADPFRFESRP